MNNPNVTNVTPQQPPPANVTALTPLRVPMIPKDRRQRMHLFAWTCLKIADRYRTYGFHEQVRRLCNRAEYFFQQAEAAGGGA